MKNTNPLISLLEATITPEQLRLMPSLKKDFFGAKKAVKAARDAAKKSKGKRPFTGTSGSSRRGGRDGESGIFVSTIFGKSRVGD